MQNILSLRTFISLKSEQTTPLLLAHLLIIYLVSVNISHSNSTGERTFVVGGGEERGECLNIQTTTGQGVVFYRPLPPEVAENFQVFQKPRNFDCFFSIQRKFCPGPSPSHLSPDNFFEETFFL